MHTVSNINMPYPSKQNLGDRGVMMKKIINAPEHVVPEFLSGFAAANPALVYEREANVIARKELGKKVALISGGGSGHEPAHVGYVGKGMLDAAVAGNVFASPSADQVLQAIHKVNMGKGVLLIIKNYSGDVMNFEMASELAEFDDIEVASVIVADDVSIQEVDGATGRRGIAGTVFVHKIAGAAAEEGRSLAEVKAVAEKVISNVRTMGMAMSSCTIPAVGKPGFSLGENEIEIGMGIHGEPGIFRTKVMSAEALANELCSRILADLDYAGREVAVLVNGLGSTPQMELYILYHEVEKLLAAKNIRVYRSYVGNYMTAIEMAGASVSLLRLDDELKTLLDAPADTPAFKQFS